MSESPIFDAVQRDLAGQQAREFVRASFPGMGGWGMTCPTCGARKGHSCRTKGGKPTSDHKARWSK